jgi:hypothetical protein
MTNIGAINSIHIKNHGLPLKFVTFIAKWHGMACHHHMEDIVVINRKRQ